ncbi:hypothetical protein [Acetobacter sp. LMG 32666]|uniref:hypothetical protein n=1 Tax=Acetobacter sp. LMG 32666 TaxID=2959295 RepID=UPI0030C84639
MVLRSKKGPHSALVVAACGLALASLAGGQAHAQQVATPQQTPATSAHAEGEPPAEAPAITPSVDVDVEYELASPQGDVSTRQRMRWQVATLRQRLDPDKSAVFMLTSWRDRTLSVVDNGRKRVSIMPVPGTQQLTPPGQPAMVGSYARLGSSVVAGEQCTVWRTKDTDGHPTDACYTADGVLLQVAQGGQITVRALSVQRTAQPDSLFVIPPGLRQEAPAHP